MKQEDKELLLKDLCARLPYDVIVIDHYGFVVLFTWKQMKDFEDGYICKPYLRQMSSMTEEEKLDYTSIDNRAYCCPQDFAHIPATDRIDWLNKRHFDYRGLIEKGLAIEVTEKNNPYEN